MDEAKLSAALDKLMKVSLALTKHIVTKDQITALERRFVEQVVDICDSANTSTQPEDFISTVFELGTEIVTKPNKTVEEIKFSLALYFVSKTFVEWRNRNE